MINWKLRLKNKVTLTTLVGAIIGTIYCLLNIVGVLTNLSVDEALGMMTGYVVAIVGIIIDPTTDGLSDSDRAMTYDEPRKSE